MPKTIYTSEARQDFRDIFRYIARDRKRPSVAAKNIREIKAKCKQYAEAFAKGSEIGTARPELGHGCRTFTEKRWVIIFRDVDDEIEVLRIVDGGRDYSKLFGS